MPQNSGGNDGYQLRITYNVETREYYLTGYVIFKDNNNRMRYDADGASLSFRKLEDAIAHITDYPESLKKLAGL